MENMPIAEADIAFADEWSGSGATPPQLVFSFYGILDQETPESGTYPIFDDSVIFQLWASVVETSDSSISVQFRKRAGGGAPFQIGSVVIPSGQQFASATVNISLSEGDRISVIADPGSPSAPGAELSAVARLS